MHLTRFTDYSLRVLMYVAVAPPDKRATMAEIADAYGISRSHLTKVLQHLGKPGLLRNARGRGGGLELVRPALEFDVGEVVRSADSDTPVVECFNHKTNRCAISAVWRLRDSLKAVNDSFYAVLSRYSLADVTAKSQPLARLLLSRPAAAEWRLSPARCAVST